MLSDSFLGRLAQTLAVFTCVFVLGTAAHASDATGTTEALHHLDRGLDLRAGISVVPAWVTLR